jgi:DNA repair protein RecN (Recombination protein N)
MLTRLAIRDIVLVARLDLAFAPGLCVLTGETGAGKSIVLDALGLALGGRAERGLVRVGAEHGSVTACFEPPADHPAWSMLAEQGLPEEGELVLRRLLGADGRSRAFVNDEPVSGQMLRRLGDTLVEIHGQNEQRGLLNAGLHREILDSFAGLEGSAAEVAASWAAWREALGQRDQSRKEMEAARHEEDYLRHRAHELEDLAAQSGEEERLAERRHRLMNREKLASALTEAAQLLAAAGGARERLTQALRRLDRARLLAGEFLEPAVAALGRALVELDEAEAALDAAGGDLDLDAGALDEVETRLFALRDAARKYRVGVEDLPGLLAGTRQELDLIDSGADRVLALEHRLRECHGRYIASAERLSAERRVAAERLAVAVQAELPPLKLDRSRFRVAVEPFPEEDWGPMGSDRVGFEVSTNPGQPFGALARIASGGELSRFMLALKVVLVRQGVAQTLIFDEIDAGVGGATAAAVGERLAGLGRERQVLVVTHAPQVAALADHHLSVLKEVQEGMTSVAVRPLDRAAREQEIGRMLAGAEITEAARAAAASLLSRP